MRSMREDGHARAYDSKVIARLWRYLRPHWRPLAGALTLLPASAALHLLPPYLIKIVIDDAIVPGYLQRLTPLCALLIGTLLVQEITMFGHMILLQVCGQRAMHDLRTRAHAHVVSLNAGFFDRTPVGSVMTRVTNDVESITEALSSGLLTVVGDLLKLLGIVTVMLWMNMRLALLTFAVLPLLLLVVGIFRRLMRATYRTIRRRLALINSTLQEQISGMKIVQMFGQEAESRRRFDAVNREYRDAYQRAIGLDATLFALVEMLGSVTVALLLWYGGIRLLAGATTFGLLVAFIEYVQRFFEPVRDISAKYAIMQQAMAAAERVFGLLDSDDPDCPAATSEAAPYSMSALAPAEHTTLARPPFIEFRNVKFGYGTDQKLFDDLSFSVGHRENIAIVGATGAGKSSLVRLLIRLYEIQQGAILLDGVDIRRIEPQQLRRRVVVLSQEVFLFRGSVRHNISLDDPAITDDAVTQAANRIGVTKLLDLNAEVLERGSNLSMGERQLIVFARALARDPEVLVLDEATASVDPESEQLIQDGIAELMRQRTAIVIAHRLSTIEQVRRVLVLHQGAIAEQGSHEQLLRNHNIYARLYQLQYVSG